MQHDSLLFFVNCVSYVSSEERLAVKCAEILMCMVIRNQLFRGNICRDKSAS